MARFTRMEVLQTVIEQGLVPVFYNADPENRGEAWRFRAAGRAAGFSSLPIAAISLPMCSKNWRSTAAEKLPEMIVGGRDDP